MQRIQNEQGFTVLEALVASVIILFMSLVTLGMFVAGYRHTATSERLTTAVNLARAQLEQVRNTPFEEIPATFPSNENEPAVLEGIPDAQWVIEYPDGAGADPLAVELTVRWVDKDIPHQVVLNTLIANANI